MSLKHLTFYNCPSFSHQWHSFHLVYNLKPTDRKLNVATCFQRKILRKKYLPDTTRFLDIKAEVFLCFVFKRFPQVSTAEAQVELL